MGSEENYHVLFHVKKQNYKVLKFARWFRLRVKRQKISHKAKPVSIWHVSDITKDRIRQENAFQELQNAIHYLDHAPAGFLSSEGSGSLVYINATLADWLGIDLTRRDLQAKSKAERNCTFL